MSTRFTARPRSRVAPLMLASALGVVALTGCQSSAPDLDADAATRFQATVLTVTQAVADGELQLARDTLTTFDTELEEAAADGSVSFARHKRIDAALAAVLADVDAALAAQAPAPVEPEPQPTTTVTPVSPTTPVPDEENEDEPDESEPDESEPDGPGNGNGNNEKEPKAPKEPKEPKAPKAKPGE
ncbi:hypothetical protein [Mycetocola zhujimingii]|uniref:Mucin-associated surface protein n=1 Tax=Mycetocola zhujimingii TaxID=2079792 RepID=A0A2U1TA64_9MICO|nr:hypothetical protein [Mycetocola zhujimingii]PWC04579.1 hypothetical protein DF223_14075 [Mycetocola zhujimingii]